MAEGFVHLHNHTEYSMLDGAARVRELVTAARDDGQPALAITDHGNLYGLVDFYDTCRSEGIKPILGIEAYMAAHSRFDRPTRRGKLDDTGGDTDGGQKLYHHLTLLAETTEGYANLIRASSMAFLEGYYYKPRLDWELLERYSKGLIATSGCLGGVVLQALVHDDYPRAVKLAGQLQAIFGRDNFFVELQDHGLSEQRRTNPQLVELAREIGAPLLATNDLHYVRPTDWEMHDALLCVGTGSLMADPDRFRFHSNEHYLKSATEMRYLFRELPEACDNTLLVAERARAEIDFDLDAMPAFPLPGRYAAAEADHRKAANAYLRDLVMAGAAERYGNPLPESVSARLEYELATITDMGFADYFLVVWDLIRFARESKIRVGPGRGSTAGCCVAYCLNIVDLDPLRYGLIFERFLNAGRKQMPDIDMDFDERFRGEMIRYAADRYGTDHVAQIVTFSTIKARAAVRDAARVLGYSPVLGDRIAKAMPPLVMGKDMPLAACLSPTEEFKDRYHEASELRAMYETDDDVRRTVDVALGLVDKRRQDGIHAAAVVITKEPVTTYAPVQRKPGPNGAIEDAPVVTQFEMHAIAKLGLLKMDFLGLRNLAIIERALDLIERTTGERVDIDRIPLDDPAVFTLLQRGESIGVFQLEGTPMRALMRRLRPTTFDDLAALVALYRPGPMAENVHHDYADRKNKRQEVRFDHPALESVLADTLGLMIYQEDIMKVAQSIAGFSMTEADDLRSACSKKDAAKILTQRSRFIDGVEANGYPRHLGELLFNKIEPFADYAFPKSHAYGYGLLAYQNTWLKAHYPVEYLAALLTSFKDDKDKTALYLAECRACGVTVRGPDVNESVADFAPSQTLARTINFGLAAVRNVGEALVERIVAEREARGPFASIYDFVRRVDPMVLNKRTMESLAKAGAFDSLGVTRQGLTIAVDELVDKTLDRRRQLAVGISTLFAAASESGDDWEGTEVPLPAHEFERAHLLAFEREMLGLYVSDHPLLGVEADLRRQTSGTIAELREQSEEFGEGGETVTVGGVLSEVQLRTSKRGESFARVVLEDLTGSLEVLVFAKAFAASGALLRRDQLVLIKGRLERRDDELRFTANAISQPTLRQGPTILNLVLPTTRVTAEEIRRLKSILAANPGPVPVILRTDPPTKTLRLDDIFAVDPATAVAELRAAFGPQVIATVPSEGGTAVP